MRDFIDLRDYIRKSDSRGVARVEVVTMFDKFKSCEDCPDRTVEPNCHMTCEGYIFRCQKNEKSKESKNENVEFGNFKRETIRKTKKRLGM